MNVETKKPRIKPTLTPAVLIQVYLLLTRYGTVGNCQAKHKKQMESIYKYSSGLVSNNEGKNGNKRNVTMFTTSLYAYKPYQE